MPNFATSFALVETATKCRATDFSSPPNPASDQARADCALVIVSSVVNVFEETMNSVSAGSRSRTASDEVGPVDVGNEPESHVALAVVAQRLVGHDRAEIGTADPDIDDVADALARMAFPLAAPDLFAEVEPSGRARRGPAARRSCHRP